MTIWLIPLMQDFMQSVKGGSVCVCVCVCVCGGGGFWIALIPPAPYAHGLHL